MYMINTIPHGKCFVYAVAVFCIRNLTRSLRSLVRFLIRQQLVRKYHTPTLFMKYSLFMSHIIAKMKNNHQINFIMNKTLCKLIYWGILQLPRIHPFSLRAKI